MRFEFFLFLNKISFYLKATYTESWAYILDVYVKEKWFSLFNYMSSKFGSSLIFFFYIVILLNLLASIKASKNYFSKSNIFPLQISNKQNIYILSQVQKM